MARTPGVFITGVSSGIGHALVQAYLDAGWAVYGLSRRTPEKLQNAKHFKFVSADVAAFDDVPDKLIELLDGVKSLDLVVLNAGIIGDISDLQDAPLEEVKHTMDVNLWSNKVIIDTLTTMPLDVNQIVAISSGASVNGNRGWSGYALSKAALNMLVQLYANELPDTHITALAPGLVDTAMQDHLCNEVDDDRFESLERLRAARNTENMPDPTSLAPTLIETFAKLRAVPSGEFRDIRQM